MQRFILCFLLLNLYSVAILAQYSFDVKDQFSDQPFKVTIDTSARTITISNNNENSINHSFYDVNIIDGSVGFAMDKDTAPILKFNRSKLSFIIHENDIWYNNPNTNTIYKFIPVNESIFTSIYKDFIETEKYTFYIRNVETSEIYSLHVNLLSKKIYVRNGSKDVFTHSFDQATMLESGIAFTFRQGRIPSLKTDMDDWFFCIKPTTVEFYNLKDKMLVITEPQNSASFAGKYETLSSELNRIFTVKGIQFTMVYVKGGTFQMGSNEGEQNEKPAHSVTLSSFSIGQTEVTQALWKAVMGGYNPSSHDGNEFPVENVSWNACQVFLRNLNELTGLNFRFPSEAEWEFAARGGIFSKGYIYAGSDSIDNVAWFRQNSFIKGTNSSSRQIHKVGSKSPNELGIYDMSGNVCELCNDYYGDYTNNSQTNPQGPSTGKREVRVVRGGRYDADAIQCRVTSREAYYIRNYGFSTGLRLAL